MTEQPRNWDKELADIDKVIAKQGRRARGVPRPARPPARRARSASGYRRRAASRARFVALTWFWMGLALLLAAALPLWPYDKSCGLQLFFYLGAAGMALLAGRARRLASWRTDGVWPTFALARGRPVGRCHGVHARSCRGSATARQETWICPVGAGPPAPAADTGARQPLMPSTTFAHSMLHGQDLQELHRRRVGRSRDRLRYFENRNPADTSRPDRAVSRFRPAGRGRRGALGQARLCSSGRARRLRSAATCSAGSAICWSSGRRRSPTR